MRDINGFIELGDRGIIKDLWFHGDITLIYNEHGGTTGCVFEGNVKILAPSTSLKMPNDRFFTFNNVSGILCYDGVVAIEGNYIGSDRKLKEMN